MGVGLSIARWIVIAHGGRIWAANGAAGGAEFRFTLRTAAAATGPDSNYKFVGPRSDVRRTAPCHKRYASSRTHAMS